MGHGAVAASQASSKQAGSKAEIQTCSRDRHSGAGAMPQCGARWGTTSRKCALCSIVTALLVPSFRGQSTTQGVVGGMVAGPGGAALGDAEVDLTNTDT